MQHVRLTNSPTKYVQCNEETGKVHYEGCGMIGSHTLCGHTDWISATWEITTKRVNCKGCLAVRDHVTGR